MCNCLLLSVSTFPSPKWISCVCFPVFSTGLLLSATTSTFKAHLAQLITLRYDASVHVEIFPECVYECTVLFFVCLALPSCSLLCNRQRTQKNVLFIHFSILNFFVLSSCSCRNCKMCSRRILRRKHVVVSLPLQLLQDTKRSKKHRKRVNAGNW